MRDMHCHILPGVDDGSQSMEESFAMLQTAMSVGITEIVCTPHCRDPYFDYDAMWAAYETLATAVPDMPIRMGFEVNHTKLMELGRDDSAAHGLRGKPRQADGAWPRLD